MKLLDSPDLILGTALWNWTIAPKICHQILDLFYQSGFRQVDAATNYPINHQPADFRKSEQILEEWVRTNGVHDLQITMKIGSINNMGTPEHNLSKSFVLLNLEDYRNRFESNLNTFMIHWDNRQEKAEISKTLEALETARKQGLRIGLSGIKHPEIYYDLNAAFQFDFRFQMKHNLLKSDYLKYQLFHGKRRFNVYGINAAGLKFDTKSYRNNSSLVMRGGQTPEMEAFASQLKAFLLNFKENPGVSTFNECGMTYAFHSPDIEGILIGPSSTEQLQSSIQFFNQLQSGGFYEFYLNLVKTMVKV